MAPKAMSKKIASQHGRDKFPANAPAIVPEQSAVEVKTVVRPVQNAIAILRHLVEVSQPCTVTQIARTLQINPSTCFNILRTLVGEGVVTFDSMTKTYKIGVGVLSLASNAISEENRLAAARPHIQGFAAKSGTTACLWRRLSPDRNILIACEHSPGNVRIDLQVGQSLPALLGSTGRIMATKLGLTKAQVRAEFRKLRWFNAPDFESFWQSAKEAEKIGWSFDDGNFAAGVLTVSAPVLSGTGHISYSLSSLTFRDHYPDKKIDPLGEGLVALATKLSPVLY